MPEEGDRHLVHEGMGSEADRGPEKVAAACV
jgi:hypothetical protein